MPTVSQFKILRKIGIAAEGRSASARQHELERAAEEAEAPVYVPPVAKVFAFGRREVDLQRLRATEAGQEEDGSCKHFPEMKSMATLVSRPGISVEDMTADEIMTRLHELGWRKEGEAGRLLEERRRR